MKNPVKNVILAGGGKISYYLAKNLIQSGIDVTIIEQNPSRADFLSDELPEATIILGDATDRGPQSWSLFKTILKSEPNNIDVLSMTATPIPRTLQMSLLGVKDLSVIETPPVNRLPIQTYLLENNDSVIREAINREMGGRV